MYWKRCQAVLNIIQPKQMQSNCKHVNMHQNLKWVPQQQANLKHINNWLRLRQVLFLTFEASIFLILQYNIRVYVN